MKKALILYYSKFGSTKKYAEWIASELNGDVFDLKNINKIMYYSNFGNLEEYAKWIAFELNDSNFNLENVKQNLFIHYETIIIGSGIYAGNIKCINILMDNYTFFKDKKIALFTCGLSDYNTIENVNRISKIFEEEIPENIRNTIKIYFFRGGIDYKILPFKYKLLMGFLKIMLLLKGLKKMNEQDKTFIATYGKTVDYTDKNSITDILHYCKE